RGAVRRLDVPPGSEGPPGPGHGRVRLRGTRPSDLRHHLLGGGLDDLDHRTASSALAASTSDPITRLATSSSGCQRTPSANCPGSSIASTTSSSTDQPVGSKSPPRLST